MGSLTCRMVSTEDTHETKEVLVGTCAIRTVDGSVELGAPAITIQEAITTVDTVSTTTSVTTHGDVQTGRAKSLLEESPQSIPGKSLTMMDLPEPSRKLTAEAPPPIPLLLPTW